MQSDKSAALKAIEKHHARWNMIVISPAIVCYALYIHWRQQDQTEPSDNFKGPTNVVSRYDTIRYDSRV